MPSDRLVYDTDRGRLDRCATCGRRLESCRCSRPSTARAGDGIVRIRRERKGRGGKTVTIVSGLPGDPATLAELAARLKRLCGAGGTLAGGDVELQGDHRERLAAHLAQLGYRVKLAGG